MHNAADTFDDLPILSELRESLSNAFENEDSYRSAARRPRIQRLGARTAPRRATRRTALVGGLAVAAAGATVAGLFGFQGGHLTPSSAVAATMNKFAHVAANQDWSGVPGPGQYAYTESEYQQAGYPVDHDQSWLSSGGQELVSNPETNKNDGQVESVGGPGTYFPTTVSGWQALSSDPATLLTQLKQLDAPGGPDTPAEQFTVVGDALRGSGIPAATRATVYRAVALIQGVRLMGPQTDATGEQGTGVGLYVNGVLQSELIFDPQTSQLLGEQTYNEAGDVTFAASYIKQEIVNSAPSVGETPAATPTAPFHVVGAAAPSTTQTGTATTRTSSGNLPDGR